MSESKCMVELPVRRQRRRIEIDTGAAEESFSMLGGSASTRKLVERGARVVVIKPNGKQRAFGLIPMGGWVSCCGTSDILADCSYLETCSHGY